MLKINYASNIEETTKVDALFTAISYEIFDMEISLAKQALDAQKKVLTSKDKTASEKQVAQEKIDALNLDLAKYQSELEKVADVHKSVVSEIASASKTFDNGETVSNDYEAVRNVLRLTACGENTRFFTVCNLKKSEMMPDLFEAFSEIHDVNRANTDGFIGNAVTSWKSCNKLVNRVVFEAFSIPVENDYTKAVKIRFNGTDLGIMHETWHKGLTVSVKKDAKTGDVKHDKTELNACIRKINGKDGIRYEGNGFMSNLAKVAFGYLFK